MSEATDASIPSGSPPDAPTASPSHPDTENAGVRDILAIADEVLSLERKHAPEKTEMDEALEWHEVIELQAFSERRAWIEEKIKFLEQLPPIEVFVGLDAVRTSATEVPGLPTREQLQEWMVEHDRIEKETEIFDSGELKKLKKFTKAAAQRNLSPADTDLIEITLTTIYSLDKLLHLLRDRLDNLNLLSVRLTWEERRIGAWNDRRQLLDDLYDFLGSRVRWSPSVYETLEADDPNPGEYTLKRRGSMVSMRSVASETSLASIPGYSRGARYKLAESLSQDAARFASRTSSLRHTKIASAGKALDKLIDDSRKPVPDELLDEQDKLENEGITEMEDVGKFVMQMVLQWKKADEFYVETLKDKSDAQTLLEEIEVAKLNHPTPRQDSSFMSRASALSKRLLLRGSPSFSPLFPKPEHHHFPEQAACTDVIVDQLSSEAASALQQVKKAEACAREYHASLEAVKNVEIVCRAASDLSTKFLSLIDRMENGISTSSGDGTPPDLSTEDCLDSTHHSVFLSLFPSVLQELQQANDESGPLLSKARATLLHLDFPGVDAQFKSDSTAAIDALEANRVAAAKTKDLVSTRIFALTQVRKVWSAMDRLFHETDDARGEIVDAMSRQMWRQQVRHDAPPTPESPAATLPVVATSPTHVTERLTQLQVQLTQNVFVPLSTLSPSLSSALSEYLTRSSSALEAFLNATNDTARFWEVVQQQATMMGTVRDEVHSFQIRIEDLKVRYDKGAQDIFAGSLDEDAITETEKTLAGELTSAKSTIQSFLDELPRRIPFVGEAKIVGLVERGTPKRRVSLPGLFSLETIQQAAQPTLPFDPAALDKGVRIDVNTYSMMLSGAIKALESRVDYFQLAKKAHAVDVVLTALTEHLGHASDAVTSIHSALAQGEERLSSGRLSELVSNLEDAVMTHEASIERALSPVREALQTLRSTQGISETSARDAVVSTRQKAVENAESQFNSWKKTIAGLKQQLADAHKAELHRVAEETRLREEQERLEAEAEALRAREQAAAAEAARLAELEQARVEREKADAEERERRDRERAEAEERERLERIAREKAEEEERERRARQEEEERMRRLQAEAEERAQREKAEAEERAQREQAEAEERARREQAEAEERERREKAEAEERARREAEEKARREAEERARGEAEERARREEEERLKRELLERERVERERMEKGRLEQERLERQKAEAEERERRERQEAIERAAREELERRKLEALRLAEESAIVDSPLDTVVEVSFSGGDSDDVFGVWAASSGLSPEMSDLSARIFAFRKRLRSIGINDAARPGSRSSGELPTDDTRKAMVKAFSALAGDVAKLPRTVSDEPVVATDLRSLRRELELSKELLTRVNQLADFSVLLRDCDEALSDLLEHIDSYPSPPFGPLSTPHQSDTSLTPEEQLSARLTFTRDVLSRMKTLARTLSDDKRVPAEHERILQTWSELEAMALDRIDGQKSRPSSVISSGRSSRASVIKSSSHSNKPTDSPRVRASLDSRPRHSLDKKSGFSKLSASPKFLTPPVPSPAARRAISGSSAGTSASTRSSSRLSIASSVRSVSGPSSAASGSLYGSTFSSRQRTNSTTSNSSLATPPMPKRPLPLPSTSSGSRPRAQTATRASSPAYSDAGRSTGRSSLNLPRAPTTHSTWGRAPRLSFPAQQHKSPPSRIPTAKARKPYIANPKNKLDVAVGDVVNKLPVDIKVELVADTWKDQSGKYWIGDTEPKLCFCRILRSQTVMVRVGGGWQELSRFIKDHFADAFRLLSVPENTPPRMGSKEEKWISSSTLGQAAEIISPPRPPKTPEPKDPYLPSFALSTPSGRSPQSLKTSPSPGSPLHALQFIRRAEMADLSYRPETPTRTTRSGTSSVLNTPSRHFPQPVWRP
ncbi:transporter [Ganoderma sinense ZZ0214-1]|uniref:Transporter n=1 Tax=Ganoderma sinense ZZ0214-1 TaxID=1077348 RepID=A0A2G8SSP5_9APHY|nr:transporter [Ganoderma sinense ZZ0214-1]